jgi:hypothetical protein
MSGTGFFVTPDGYLVTNGHVAQPDEALIAYYGLAQTAEEIYKDAIIAVSQAQYNYTPTETELNSAINSRYGNDFYAMVDDFYFDYQAGNLKIDNIKKNNYIQTGVAAGSENIVLEQGKGASVVSSLYEGDYDSKILHC